MTSITERNAAKLASRNGTTLPEAAPRKATRKAAVAEGNSPVAQGNDPAAPAPRQAPVPVACLCGCAAEAKPGRSYLPGHDARHAGQVARRVVAGAPGADAELAALAPALREKAARFVSNRGAETERKARAAAIRANAKAALKAELAAL